MPDHDFPPREDLKFQRDVWRVQRVAWALFIIVPAVALSGLFAHGALSYRTAEGETLSIDYEAFQRVTDLTRFVIHFSSDGPQQVRLGPRFQQDYEIESIAPQPAKSAGGGDGLHLTFDGAGGAFDAVIWAKPRRFGSTEFAVQGNGNPSVLNIFVYP